MGIPTTVRVGLGVLLSAGLLFFGTKYYVDTRTMRAVDMPVSLARGTFITGPFVVNLHAFYSIEIGRAEGGDLDCDGVGLVTRRISSLGGLVVYHYNRAEDVRGEAEHITAGTFLGGFEGKPGRYNLEIEVLSDTGCLDSLQPRLYIIASGDDFYKLSQRYENACWISFVASSIGIALVIIGVSASIRTPAAEESTLSFYEPRSREDRIARIKPERLSRYPILCHIGLLYPQFLCLIFLPMGAVIWSYGRHYVGLPVTTYVSRPYGASNRKISTCARAWAVRVQSSDVWYLNSELINPHDLSGRLRQQFGERTGCTVFFDADLDLPFDVAARAIDAIEQTPARVVLLTPATKKMHIP